jgi:hypothetical protein
VWVRSGRNSVPVSGAKVRSGGTHVFEALEGTNSSAPGASARAAALAMTLRPRVAAISTRARGLKSVSST